MSFSLDLTSFGASTVFLLLTSDVIKTLTESFIHISTCLWVLIIGAILTPMTYLGSPQDFKPVAFLATLGTVFGTALLFVVILIDFKNGSHHPQYTAPTFKSYFLSFGKILFAYGGAVAFPTFQNDMKHKEQFSLAVFYGMSGMNYYFSNFLNYFLLTLLNHIYHSFTSILHSNLITWIWSFWS